MSASSSQVIPSGRLKPFLRPCGPTSIRLTACFIPLFLFCLSILLLSSAFFLRIFPLFFFFNRSSLCPYYPNLSIFFHSYVASLASALSPLPVHSTLLGSFSSSLSSWFGHLLECWTYLSPFSVSLSRLLGPVCLAFPFFRLSSDSYIPLPPLSFVFLFSSSHFIYSSHVGLNYTPSETHTLAYSQSPHGFADSDSTVYTSCISSLQQTVSVSPSDFLHPVALSLSFSGHYSRNPPLSFSSYLSFFRHSHWVFLSSSSLRPGHCTT